MSDPPIPEQHAGKAYQLVAFSNVHVLRVADNALIPFDNANRDYIAYLQWLAVPNTADPAPAPTNAQKAATQLAQPITLHSAATGALNGTYPIDTDTRRAMTTALASVNAGQGLPGGAPTFNLPDTSGTMHAFNQANFIAYHTALRDYVYQLRNIITTGTGGLPSSTLNIP